MILKFSCGLLETKNQRPARKPQAFPSKIRRPWFIQTLAGRLHTGPLVSYETIPIHAAPTACTGVRACAAMAMVLLGVLTLDASRPGGVLRVEGGAVASLAVRRLRGAN